MEIIYKEVIIFKNIIASKAVSIKLQIFGSSIQLFEN